MISAASNPLLGDLLALAGAMMAASYIIIGRRLRKKMTLVSYTFLVYGAAAVMLVVFMLAGGFSPLGYPSGNLPVVRAAGVDPAVAGAFQHQLGAGVSFGGLGVHHIAWRADRFHHPGGDPAERDARGGEDPRRGADPGGDLRGGAERAHEIARKVVERTGCTGYSG